MTCLTLNWSSVWNQLDGINTYIKKKKRNWDIGFLQYWKDFNLDLNELSEADNQVDPLNSLNFGPK